MRFSLRAALLGGGSGGRGTLPPGNEDRSLDFSFSGGRVPTQERFAQTGLHTYPQFMLGAQRSCEGVH